MAAAQFLVIAFGLLIVACKVYAKFDRSGWNEHSIPSEDARITDETVGKLNTLMSKRYRDMRGGNYYTRKITFTFSDGFWYTSYKLVLPHDSARTPLDAFSPQWSELRQKAIDAHSQAVRKRASSPVSRRRKSSPQTLIVSIVLVAAVAAMAYMVLRPGVNLLLGKSAVGKGEYEKGIMFLKEAQSWSSGREALREAWLKFADHEISEMQAETQDYESARMRGQKLRAVDAQLRYCHALHAMSYDLSRVYPEGVVVDDAELGSYHVDNLDDTSQDRAIDASRVIVFRREQLNIPRDDDDDSENPIRYAVRLLPGSMFVLGGEFAAESFSESTCVILMDSAYVEAGAVFESSFPNVAGNYTMDTTEYARQIKTRRLPYYAAVDSLTAYNKDEPSRGMILLGKVNKPVCADETWQKEHSGIGRSYAITYNDRMGKFDRSITAERIAPIITLFFRSERQ